jgi:hypothetical protein
MPIGLVHPTRPAAAQSAHVLSALFAISAVNSSR